MRTRTATICLTAALLGIGALPAAATADYYIPPGNSAVNQYTESFPGAGGETSGKGKQGEAVPAKTLGAANAKKLQSKGVNGREAAEVAAETAPPANLYVSDGGGGQPANGGGNNNGQSQGGQGGSTGGGTANTGTTVEQPSGSSGLGSVVGQATGTSGDVDLWLPLAILATLAGAIAYRVRHHHPEPSA